MKNKSHTLSPGQLFEQRYAVVRVLGVGGFGIVYQAVDQRTGQQVALKMLQPEEISLTSNPNYAKARFRREMRVIASLNHPNIVRLLDVGETAIGQLFIVLEYIQGEDLKTVLSREGKLSMREARRVMGQVLDALSCAHQQGIVHRDLKPANIMLTTTGCRRNAMVLDFGIAGFTENKGEQPITVTGFIHGTPSYMAPEQLREQKLTSQSDIYAWGLVCFEALCGRRLVNAKTVAEIVSIHLSSDPLQLPEEILAGPFGPILQRAICKDLSKRYTSADEALSDLEDCGIDCSSPHRRILSSSEFVLPSESVVGENDKTQPFIMVQHRDASSSAPLCEQISKLTPDTSATLAKDHKIQTQRFSTKIKMVTWLGMLILICGTTVNILRISLQPFNETMHKFETLRSLSISSNQLKVGSENKVSIKSSDLHFSLKKPEEVQIDGIPFWRIVRNIFNKHAARFKACNRFAKQSGKLQLHGKIHKNGRASRLHITPPQLENTRLAQCILKSTQTLNFPKPIGASPHFTHTFYIQSEPFSQPTQEHKNNDLLPMLP